MYSNRPPLTPVKSKSSSIPFGFSTPSNYKQSQSPLVHSPAYLTVSLFHISLCVCIHDYQSRRHSVYGTETKIIIDPGSRIWKVGFSGELHPRSVFLINDDKSLWNLNALKSFIGIIDAFLLTFINHLQIDSKQKKILLVENSFLSNPIKDSIIRILFNNFQVPSIAFANSSLLALLASGRSSGLVIDIGYLQTIITPVS